MAPKSTKATKLAKRANREDAERTLATRVEDLRTKGKLHEADAEEGGAYASMAERILNADSVDAILGSAQGAAGLVGSTVQLDWVNFVESKLHDGYFAVIGYHGVTKAGQLEGTESVFTCGSFRMLLQAARMLEIGVIPGQLVKVGKAAVDYENASGSGTGDTYFFEVVR